MIWLTILLLGIIFSKSPEAGFYGLLKLGEFIFLGFYIAKEKLNLTYFFLVFSLGIFFESLLAIAQYAHQGSLGGILYFLGERTFTAQTPGIANASINGELILRPYGTFPHPNVLAAYLLITMALIVSRITYSVLRIKKIFFLLSLILGTIALFLTMSRIAIAIWLVVIGYWFVQFVMLNLFQHLRENRFRNKFGMTALMFLFIIISGIFVFLSPLRFRFAGSSFLEESAALRIQLIQSSILMTLDNPIFGVGINNFLPALSTHTSFKTYNFFQSLQPVHNIYLLVLSETGIPGFLLFIWFLIKSFKQSCKKEFPSGDRRTNFPAEQDLAPRDKFQILIIVLALGLFDHYFLTLQQGQLLMTVVLGLCWNTIRVDQDNSKRDNRRKEK